MNTQTYYPSYVWACILFFTALAFLGMWIGLVVLGLTPQSPAFPEAGSLGPAIVIGFLLFPLIILFFDISIGLFRSRVKLTDQGLDLTTTRFAIWKLRRVHRVKLAWSEVWGVQVWGQTNPMASTPYKMQIDYIFHTARGKYCVTNMVWPQAQEIAEAVASRIGRPLDDIQVGSVPVRADRPQDTWGLRLLHGLGICSMILGLIICLLGAVSLLGGTSFKDAAIVMMMGGFILSMGESLRRYRMQGMK